MELFNLCEVHINPFHVTEVLQNAQVPFIFATSLVIFLEFSFSPVSSVW
jgi:hypothetical protein